ncbi:hypothetical protein VNO77_23196 [Canavalia gladiata]|uniref:Uncharacterized protein n=1 Tax=Canavalia gladiata TaxID=3824 RepID=A0AAN9L5H0_CANGL
MKLRGKGMAPIQPISLHFSALDHATSFTRKIINIFGERYVMVGECLVGERKRNAICSFRVKQSCAE